MLVLKVLAFLWPFLKEMFFGDMGMKAAVSKYKGRFFIIGVIALSIILNLFTIPKLYAISREYVTLNKKYQSLEVAERDRSSRPERSTPADNKPPVNEIMPSNSKAPSNNNNDAVSTERYLKIKETFDRIKSREEKDAYSKY